MGEKMKTLQSALLFLLFIVFIANMLDPQFDWNNFAIGALSGFTTLVITVAIVSSLNILGSGLNSTGTFIIAAYAAITVLLFGFSFGFDLGGQRYGLQFGANLIQGLNNTIGQIPLFGPLVVIMIILMIYILITLIIFGGRSS